MATTINVAKTVEQILAVPNVQFKVLKQDEKTGATVLVTAVDDNFNRGIITISTDSVSIGVQGPNKEGNLVTTIQPLAVEVLELVVLEETAEPANG